VRIDSFLNESRHLNITIRDKVTRYLPEHSEQLSKLDTTSKKILDAILQQRDVFKVEITMQLALMSILQRQEQHASTADQEKQLAKLPNVPEAAFNSHERQHDPFCLQDTRVDVLGTIGKWIESPHERHIFWLSGLAGTGKTTIAKTIAQNHGHFTVSFFFSRGGGDTGRARKLFTSIAVQLADRSPILRQYICDAIEECNNISSLSLHDQWRYLILTPLSRLGKSFQGLSMLLVIDALDECDDEKDIKAIIQLFAEARVIHTVQFRILMTSRPDTHIRHGFHHIQDEDHRDLILHDIPQTTVNHDISIFLEYNFKGIRRERAFDHDWPGDHTIQQLVLKSSGLFIWAATACRFVRDGKRLATRRLSTIMEGGTSGTAPEQKLDKIYLTVLENSVMGDFDEEELEDIYLTLREILGSLAVLSSPLTSKALGVLLQIPKDDVNQALEDLHAILDIPAAKDQISPIRLHHPSFRDFLLNNQRCTNLHFWVDEAKAHRLVATNCIELMAATLKRDICDLKRPGIDISEIDKDVILQHLPQELQYACAHWILHLQKSDIELADNDFIYVFLQEHFLHWMEALSLIGKTTDGVLAILGFESRLSASGSHLLLEQS